ncbi:hypothetical protein BT63DRAFT_408859 [Microthyrium microscopicum]|uniref:Rhodopsin domain-containing protein n=1 Tax=Microthyrium microscopicum TaxID=703497 RepID=A0A6A6UUG4_9PEZI|nr:hypothetical protein BT63DRAFT_408859 [Microthyrium microscopicum]
MVSSPTNSQLLTESIAFWTIGLFLLLGRLWSRAILRGSWKKLQADDYMMMGTFSLYTSLLILLQFSSRYATNEFHPGELDGILANPQDVKDRIYGSKIVVGSNQAYLLTLWGVKACLLMLYYRMTRDTVNHTYVKIVIGYVIFGLIAIEVPYFFILCRPFSQYWAMPPNNTQCATYFDYCIIQMVFNVSSDLLMLGIPTPFVVGAKVPPLKRALLVGIFSLGSFVVLAAVLAKYYNFTSANSTVYMIWDVRETSVAVYVANLMCWWPLLRKFVIAE